MHEMTGDDRMDAHLYSGFGLILTACAPHTFLAVAFGVSTMATESQRPEGREGAISLLNAAINALHLTKEVSVITGAEGAFDSVNVLLTMIKVGFASSPR